MPRTKDGGWVLDDSDLEPVLTLPPTKPQTPVKVVKRLKAQVTTAKQRLKARG